MLLLYFLIGFLLTTTSNTYKPYNIHTKKLLTYI